MDGIDYNNKDKEERRKIKDQRMMDKIEDRIVAKEEEEMNKLNDQKMLKHRLIDFGPSLLSIAFLIWAITMTILYVRCVVNDKQEGNNNYIRKSTNHEPIDGGPTSRTTVAIIKQANATFRQRYHVGSLGRVFNENEVQMLQFKMEAYTQRNVIPYHDCNKINEEGIDNKEGPVICDDDAMNMTMTSTVINQQEYNSTTDDPTSINQIDIDFVNEVTYIVSFNSIHDCIALVDFPRIFFPGYTNRNLEYIRDDLNLLTPGINITLIEMAARVVNRTN